jgi:Phage integrase, N-terminal SAM-like domain
VKHGSVAQIHTRSCPRLDDGTFAPHRCKGSWRYTLEYGRDSNGRRLQTGKAGFPTKGAAQSALQEVVRTFMVDVGVHSLTVGDYLETWMAGKHALKPKTRALYGDFIRNYLLPNLGEIRLLELRAQHLDRMYSNIALGRRGRPPLSPSTIRRVHAVLRSALNTAVRRRLIPYSPAEHIELAPENPKRPKPWTLDECQTFLRDIAEDRLANLYDLILFTGMRRGEAIGLRWEDVDLDRAYSRSSGRSPRFTAIRLLGPPRPSAAPATSRSMPTPSPGCADTRRCSTSNGPRGGRRGTTPGLCSLVRTAAPCGPSTPQGTSRR